MPESMPEDVLRRAAAAFGIDAEDCRPLRGGNFSTVFAFSRQGRDFVLRLTPPSEEVDEARLRAGLDFTGYLAGGGVAVPAPQRSLRGAWIEAMDTPRGAWLAAVFERAPGVLAEELPFEVWDEERFRLLGGVVGSFHARARSYAPAPGLPRPHWDQGVNCFHPAEPIPDPLLQRRREEALADVLALPRQADGYGWIHADLHGGNFMLDTSAAVITLLDFDDVVLGWYAMDIAMLLHDFCVLTPAEDKDGFAARFLDAFLRGYSRAFPLPLVWIERLPLFLKLLETGIYAQVVGFSAGMEPDSWVGRFMLGRAERIASARPVVDVDFARIAREARP